MRKINPKRAYEDVAKIVESWCERYGYSDMLVTINVNGITRTEVLEFDAAEMTFVWANDWWEGEQQIILEGFAPLNIIRLFGFPTYKAMRENIRINQCMNWVCNPLWEDESVKGEDDDS